MNTLNANDPHMMNNNTDDHDLPKPPDQEDFSYPVFGDLGNSAPPLGADNYRVRISILPNPKGPPLLIETTQQVKARYAYYLMSQKAKWAAYPVSQGAEEESILARRDGEIAAFAKIQEQFGPNIRHYFFEFRVPTVYDVENAEAATLAPRPQKPALASSPPSISGAGQSVDLAKSMGIADPELAADPESTYPVRSRVRFRRHLAASTFQDTNYPNFRDLGKGYDVPLYAAVSYLPNAVQEIVLADVAQRIAFNSDALAFLETWGQSSSTE